MGPRVSQGKLKGEKNDTHTVELQLPLRVVAPYWCGDRSSHSAVFKEKGFHPCKPTKFGNVLLIIT
jgi:hypothetical protein